VVCIYLISFSVDYIEIICRICGNFISIVQYIFLKLFLDRNMIIDPILKRYGRRVVRSVRMCRQTMYLVKTKFLRQGCINFTKKLRDTSDF